MPWSLRSAGFSKLACGCGGAWIAFIILGRTVLRGARPSLLRVGRPPLRMALRSAQPQLRPDELLLRISQHLGLLGAWLSRPVVQPAGPLAEWLLLRPMPAPQHPRMPRQHLLPPLSFQGLLPSTSPRSPQRCSPSDVCEKLAANEAFAL